MTCSKDRCAITSEGPDKVRYRLTVKVLTIRGLYFPCDHHRDVAARNRAGLTQGYPATRFKRIPPASEGRNYSFSKPRFLVSYRWWRSWSARRPVHNSEVEGEKRYDESDLGQANKSCLSIRLDVCVSETKVLPVSQYRCTSDQQCGVEWEPNCRRTDECSGTFP
jgi:hypothetical protein